MISQTSRSVTALSLGTMFFFTGLSGLSNKQMFSGAGFGSNVFLVFSIGLSDLSKTNICCNAWVGNNVFLDRSE